MYAEIEVSSSKEFEGLEEESNVGSASRDCAPPVLLSRRERFGIQQDIGLTLSSHSSGVRLFHQW